MTTQLWPWITRQVLKSNGIDLKAAQFGTYQGQPMYDWKNPKHKVIGYRVTSDITLKLRDFQDRRTHRAVCGH